MIKKYLDFINEDFELPNQDEVDSVLKYLYKNYPIGKSEFGQYIVIDDKSNFLKNRKGYLTNKLYQFIKDNLSFSEPSIRKAIKDYLSNQI